MPAPEITPEYRKAVLAELVEIGVFMARAAKAEVETGETPRDRVRAMAAYPHVARAIRQSLAFEDQLAQTIARAAREAEVQAGAERDARRARTRARVRRHVSDTLYARFGEDWREEFELPEQLDDGLCGLRDWLDEETLDPAVLDLPFEELVARIEADLGLDDTPAPPATAAPRLRPGPRRKPARPRRPPPAPKAAKAAEPPKPEPPPPEPPRPAASEPQAEPQAEPQPTPAPPIEAAPPKPPDPPPEPYIPPWERLRPGQVFPGGGTGW